MHATYQVPADQLPALQAEVEKLNRRAAKLGVEPIHLDVGEGFLHENGDFAWLAHEVAIDGEAPQLNGWRFIGTINWLKDDNGAETPLLLLVPGEEVPDAVRKFDKWCDHCKTHRWRKDTYLVKNEDGTVLQVGSNCLKDFLGYHQSPHAYARWAEAFALFVEGLGHGWDNWGGGIGNEHRVRIETFLAAVVARASRIGWLSGKRAWEDYGNAHESTAWQVWERFTLRNKEVADIEQVLPADEDLAAEILEWVQEEYADREGLNDFLYNLAVATGVKYVTVRTKGIVAAVWPVWKRHQNEVELDKKANEWLGEPKARLTWDVKVTDVLVTEGYYGTTTKIAFEDEAGNALIWWASGYHTELVAGDHVELTATVKKLDEFRGRKQTVVTRAKVKILEEAA